MIIFIYGGTDMPQARLCEWTRESRSTTWARYHNISWSTTQSPNKNRAVDSSLSGCGDRIRCKALTNCEAAVIGAC
jgi:hypothetical protein